VDEIFVGIDGGQNTGFAVWNRTRTRFEHITTYSFWECIEELQSLKEFCEKEKHSLTVVVEDVSANKTTFKRKRLNKWAEDKGIELNERITNKISRNVGSVMRETDLLIEWIERAGIKLIKSKPNKNSMTKLSADTYKNMTKEQRETNQHERDASMLVWER
jgi:hypothetical protein